MSVAANHRLESVTKQFLVDLAISLEHDFFTVRPAQNEGVLLFVAAKQDASEQANRAEQQATCGAECGGAAKLFDVILSCGDEFGVTQRTLLITVDLAGWPEFNRALTKAEILRIGSIPIACDDLNVCHATSLTIVPQGKASTDGAAGQIWFALEGYCDDCAWTYECARRRGCYRRDNHEIRSAMRAPEAGGSIGSGARFPPFSGVPLPSFLIERAGVTDMDRASSWARWWHLRPRDDFDHEYPDVCVSPEPGSWRGEAAPEPASPRTSEVLR